MAPVILWITFIVFLVLATLHFLPQLVCWINGGALFSPDVMVNLYVAAFNLEAALLIALLIYSLQVSSERRDHKARSRNAKRILLTELESGLEYIVRQPKAGNTAGISSLLSDLLIAYLPDIQKDLLPNQLHHLIKITDILITMAHQAVEQDSGEAADYLQSHLCFLVREAFLPAMGSPFSDVFFRIGDFRTALNEETQTVLTTLASKETSLPPVDGERLLDTKGNPLVEVMDNGRTRIWDEKGMLLCDAVLNDNNVDLSGWKRGGLDCQTTRESIKMACEMGMGAFTPRSITINCLMGSGRQANPRWELGLTSWFNALARIHMRSCFLTGKIIVLPSLPL